jgi:hypothetical protein
MNRLKHGFFERRTGVALLELFRGKLQKSGNFSDLDLCPKMESVPSALAASHLCALCGKISLIFPSFGVFFGVERNIVPVNYKDN